MSFRMRAGVVREEYGGKPEIVELPAEVEPGQMLIEIAAAGMNPIVIVV